MAPLFQQPFVENRSMHQFHSWPTISFARRRIALMAPVVIGLAAVSGNLAIAPLAFASSYTCTTQGGYVGKSNGGVGYPSYEGISVSVDSTSLGFCQTVVGSSNYSLNGSWIYGATPLDGKVVSGVGNWYQQGCNLNWSEYSEQNGTLHDVYNGCVDVTETHQYWQSYDDGNTGGCVCEHSRVDSIIFQSTNYDPKSSWTSPWYTSFLSQTSYQQSDVVGPDSAHKANYQSMQLEYASTQQWTSIMPTLYSINTNYNIGTVTTTWFQVWN